MRFIDLSHVIEDGMTTYPGFPPVAIGEFLSRDESRGKYADGVTFQIGRIDMIANTGTYVDVPFHRYPDGGDLADVALDRLAGLPGVYVRAPHADGRAVDVDRVRAAGDVRGRAVVVHTGWSQHWRTPMYGDASHSFMTRGAAAYLADTGAAVVAIDTVNIDPTADPERPAYSILLAAGIPIVEHLRGAEELANARAFTFFAVPPRVRGMGSFAVRAFAIAG
jgi:kynurenine formamidase